MFVLRKSKQDLTEIMDHWCHVLIEDTGAKHEGGEQTSSILGPLLMGCQKTQLGLQAEESHVAKPRENVIKG